MPFLSPNKGVGQSPTIPITESDRRLRKATAVTFGDQKQVFT
jgi:hypothetical protein